VESVPGGLLDTVCAMRVELVDDLAALQSEWVALFDGDPAATPFSSFEWLSAWCRHWAGGGKPWILAVYDGERLAGSAAFLLRRRGGMRLLNGLGVGVGNYWDVLAAPEDRERVVAEVARALDRRSSEWDALSVDKLPEESCTGAALSRAGLRIDRRMQWPSPRIELPETFDEYLASLSKNRRSRIRRNLRAVDAGDLVVSTVAGSSALRETIKRWQALRVEWWAKRERPMDPEHGSERFLAFTEEAIVAMVPRGLAMVCEVRYHDELVGITIDFLDESTFYYWLWGFDSRFEELRPGHTLIAYGIRWSIETGRRYYDLMIGEEPYKQDYAPVDRAVLSMTVGNRRLRSRATVDLSRLRHTALPDGMGIPVFGRRAAAR
jgi:CelD/BcsL family acetyltransferase involved in cellulose biosynthesis